MYLNNGVGVFTMSELPGGDTNFYAGLSVADLDGDGDMDII
jgi:hypothetical protein